jgi:hypothetical protein
MTVPLSPSSPRREHARRFGDQLRQAMAERHIGMKTLGPQLGMATSAIAAWRSGQNLPTLKTALRLSEGLQWPELAEIARDARMGVCPIDGRSFLNEGGKPKTYCSDRCRDVAIRRRAIAWEPDADIIFAKAIEGLVRDASRGVRKAPLLDAVATFRKTRGRRRIDIVLDDVSRHQAAVEAFCRSCEPEGFCRTPACELRPVSPLPLEPRLVLPEPVHRAQGAWGPINRPTTLAASRAALQRRWSRPGAHEEQAERSRRWWDGLTPAERVERGRVISERRRGKASRRACGCPNRKHLDDCPLLKREVPA